MRQLLAQAGAAQVRGRPLVATARLLSVRDVLG